MSVELYPEELGFRRPFTNEVTEVLRITNPSLVPVAFKVKTTAPKQYCVRPNSGIVPPQSNVEVQVLLQAMKEDPAPDARCRDKFLVQSVAASGEDEANIASLWSTVEKTNKAAIQEKKIRVHFLPAGATKVNGSSKQEDDHVLNAPSTPQFGSPAPATTHDSVTTTGHESSRSVAPAPTTTETSGISGALAAVTNAVPTTSEELKQQLADAQAQISKLTNQLTDPELRQRKVQEATEKVQTIVQQTNDSGVPLQVVAGLCLLSFLIAYLFF